MKIFSPLTRVSVYKWGFDFGAHSKSRKRWLHSQGGSVNQSAGQSVGKITSGRHSPISIKNDSIHDVSAFRLYFMCFHNTE